MFACVQNFVEGSRQTWNHLRILSYSVGRPRLKCEGTRAETRFRLSAKRTSPFKTAGASVQSTVGSRGVRISGRNAGYTTFRGSVKSTGYPLHSPVSPSLPLPCVTVCHHISTGLYTNLQGIETDYSPQCNDEFKVLWGMYPLLHTQSWRVHTLWEYMCVISTGRDFLFPRLIVKLKFVTEQEVASCLSSPAQEYQSNPFLNLSQTLGYEILTHCFTELTSQLITHMDAVQIC